MLEFDVNERGCKNLRLRRISYVLGAIILASVTLSAIAARAQDATWQLNPGSNDFDTATNWTLNTAVPTGTASFGTSNTTSLTFSRLVTTVGGFTFNSGASSFTFGTNFNTLVFNGAGIVGGSVTFVNSGGLNFVGNSTAGTAIINNNSIPARRRASVWRLAEKGAAEASVRATLDGPPARSFI